MAVCRSRNLFVISQARNGGTTRITTQTPELRRSSSEENAGFFRRDVPKYSFCARWATEYMAAAALALAEESQLGRLDSPVTG